MKWLFALAAAVTATTAGCIKDGSFRCATDDQCGAGGMCSAPGFCSFADPTCTSSGRRFGSFAGQGLGGQCVGDLTDGGTDGPLSDGPLSDGPLTDGPLTDGGDAAPATCVSELAVGGYHACVRKGGLVECWGSDDQAQLGDGRMLRSSRPRQVVQLSNAVQLALGYLHSCARTSDGKVKCWGEGGSYQVGDVNRGPHEMPFEVPGLSGVKQIAANGYFSCAIDATDGVRCWGDNSERQLGDGTTNNNHNPVAVMNVANAQALALGKYFGCVLHSTPAGTVSCWGQNSEGQLGDNSTMVRTTAVSAMVSNVAQLTLGSHHVCVRKTDNTVWCWGSNEQGQLGRNSPAFSPVPVQVTEVAAATDLWSGWGSTCVRRPDGSTTCWGGDNSGKLGDGSPTYNQTQPLPSRYRDVLQLGFGDFFSCARLATRVDCVGGDYYGNLGVGFLTGSVTAVSASALPTDIAEITAGHYHTCARTSSGSGLCWGWNEQLQLGIGSQAGAVQPTPTPVSSLGTITDIMAGDNATCALKASGAVCWGGNGYNELGNNETPPMQHGTPVAVANLTTIDQLELDITHGCARVGGALHCWGENARGEVDTSGLRRPAPVATAITTGATVMSTGGQFTCAGNSTSVQCFGSNDVGRLGDGTDMARTGPVTVQLAAGGNLTGVLELASGWSHTCARTTGPVYCWGNGYAGQIGDGGGTPRFAAVQATGLTGVLAIAAGGHLNCAIKSDRTVACWGDNFFGQAGNPSYDSVIVPGTVTGVDQATQITVGPFHACARRMDGSVRCWGNNENGELGGNPKVVQLDQQTALLSCP